MFARLTQQLQQPTRQIARLTTSKLSRHLPTHLPRPLLSQPIQFSTRHTHLSTISPSSQNFSTDTTSADGTTTSTAFPGDGQLTENNTTSPVTHQGEEESAVEEEEEEEEEVIFIKTDVPSAASAGKMIDHEIEMVNPDLFPEGLPPRLAKELQHIDEKDISSWVMRNLSSDIVTRLEKHVDVKGRLYRSVVNNGVQIEADNELESPFKENIERIQEQLQDLQTKKTKAKEDDNWDEVRGAREELRETFNNEYHFETKPEPLKDGIIVLSGPKLTGKSTILCQVVQWARTNGWIVMYTPDSGSLLRKSRAVQPSRHYEGYYDQPDLAVPLLANFRQAHVKQLNKLPYQQQDEIEIRPTYIAERQRKDDQRKKKTGKSGKGIVTLLDICDHGLLNPADAATSYRDLREQLSVVENEETKILFVIDDVNTMYSDSGFGVKWNGTDALGSKKKNVLGGDKFTLSGSIRPFDQNGLRKNFVPKRGAVLAAVTGTSEWLPSHMKVKHDAGAMFQYTVPVQQYVSNEFEAAVRMYGHNGILHKSCDKQDIAKSKVATSCHPGHLYEHVLRSEIKEAHSGH